METESDSVPELVRKLISDNKVMVFSKSYCPYCSRTKRLMDEKGIKFSAIELDNRIDGSDIQDYLATITGQNTTPNVFANGHHVGTLDETVAALNTTKFQELLNGPAGKFADEKPEDTKEEAKTSE
ncbi:Glutaredoxin [Coemansia sp. RSA 1939]|nr:Glutaredoxin [Coemansia sp. RSA 1939]KAJ2600043.1 Glutaredoxin [Coemansia sp. RSA 1804]KAJ2645603.1 Glutaredoxin [Coemansia sp. RSA 1285]